MAWYYKPPQSFPAVFVQTLREAGGNPGEPVLLAALPNVRDLKTISAQFNWFKWCLKQVPDAAVELSYYALNYKFRAVVNTDTITPSLWVVASNPNGSEFERLNPELAASIASECQ